MAADYDAQQTDKLKARVTYVGALVNVFLTCIKITFGILGQSAALIADGVHSLSDLLSDLIVIFAIKLGSREADHEHPYGHRRFETMATALLGTGLIAIGGAIAWDVMGGVARRSWAGNESSITTAIKYNQDQKDTDHITLPFLARAGLVIQPHILWPLGISSMVTD